MTITAEQLQTLSIYVPPAVARQSFENPLWQPGGTWRHFYAATMFAGISGITSLAETLAANGDRGAEELSAVFNRIFETIITTVEQHGGQVSKFGSNALSLAWPVDAQNLGRAAGQAVGAAFAIQAKMAEFAAVSTSRGNFEMHIKIGVSAGQVLEAFAGGVFGRWEYVLAGPPMSNMTRAKNLAQTGQVVVDETVWKLLNGQTSALSETTLLTESCVLGQKLDAGFYQITDLRGGPPPTLLASPDWSQLNESAAAKVAATLRSYIPGAISNRLESGHIDMLAELKPMTICSVGFQGIDYANDPDAATKLSNFMRDAQEIIYFYEGSVNKLAVGDTGSVLLVLFGAPPFFHEDDEIRAIAGSLGLCKVAARHNLSMRVGLAAGAVFAGPLGAPQRREYCVIGDAVNLATRLMRKAGHNQVWVDQSAQRKAAQFFEYTDLGNMQIKGKSTPRHIYRALREKEQEQQEAGAKFLLTELTGRGKELDVIEQLADRVFSGYGQVLLLNGEAGVGKSRLADEIVRRWLERGGTPHTGDCLSYGRHTPYLPWRGILSSIVGLSPRLSLEQRLTRLENTLSHLPLPVIRSGSVAEDYWLERLPLLAGIMGLETKESGLTRNLSETLRRDNIFATIRAVVLEEARRRPTLILLEDTHWSDELSLDLAADLAGEITGMSVFLVLVHRPLSSPVPVSYHRLQSMSCTARQQVNELGPEASLKLVQNKLGVKSLPPELADLILGKGQGNPFFTEELVNALQDVKAITVKNGKCALTGDLSRLELPDTVQNVVLARINRLQEEERLTLKVAAVIGRSFQLDLLEAIHPRAGGRELQAHLAWLQAQDFTRQEYREGHQTEFLFKHAITQEVAYETMAGDERRRLHATIGVALESRYRGREAEIIDLLAHHYSRSDDRQKALKYLHLAGDKALNGHANEAATSYFTEALDVAKEIDNVKVPYSLLAGREQANDRLGDREAQARDLDEMNRLARQHNNPVHMIESGNRRVQLSTNLGDYHEAIATADETLILAREYGEYIWEARTLTTMGITCWRQGDYNRARVCMREALQSTGALEDAQLKATSLNYLGLIHTQISEYEQAREDYRQALELFDDIGDRGGEAGCANNIGLLESSLGHYEQAEKFYTQALSICHTIGDRLREGISLNTLGQVNTILGNFDLAKEQLAHSLSIRQAIGDRRGEAFCLHDLGYMYLSGGHPDEAISMFHSACNLRHELGETGNYVASLAGLGEANLTKGDIFTARQCLQEAANNLRSGTGSGEYPPQQIWWLYSQVCRILGQSNEADEALQLAYALVQDKVEQIKNPEIRQSYLENVTVNAAIISDVQML